MSLNSLKRRVKGGVTPCPVCHAELLDTQRREHEFSEIQSAAERNGLQVTGTLTEYQNQRSPLAIGCERCATCTARPMRAGKIKAGQVCLVIAREKQAMARRLPFRDVQNTCLNHPLALTLLSTSTRYENNQSKLELRCANDHSFEMNFSDLQRRDRVRGCPQCAEPIGQALAIALLAKLLAVAPLRQYTPSFLNNGWPKDRGALRFDAFFPEVVIAGQPRAIAFEYHGPQHFDETHYFHQISCHGAAESFRRLREGDQHKISSCTAHGVICVVVAAQEKTSVSQLFERLSSALRLILPAFVADASYLDRETTLTDATHRALAVRASAVASSDVERLRAQLDERAIDLIAHDSLARRATCRCRTCAHQWSAGMKNLLEGVSTRRRGTGCPGCKAAAHANRSRLSEAIVKARALSGGWLPLWDDGTYVRQTQTLAWRCAAPGCSGRIVTAFSHLQRRRCPVCATRAKRPMLPGTTVSGV